MSPSYTIEPTTSEHSSTIDQIHHQSTPCDYPLAWFELIEATQRTESSKTADLAQWTAETEAYLRSDVDVSKLANLFEFVCLWLLEWQPLAARRRFLKPLYKWPQVSERLYLSQALAQTVLDLFTSIPEVDAIYLDGSENEAVFWVFTSNEKYDDGLMEILISREEVLLDSYPEAAVSIRFIPSVLCHSGKEVVGSTAKLIFERKR